MQAVGFFVGERTVFFVLLSESGFHSLQRVGDWGSDFFHERCDANSLPFGQRDLRVNDDDAVLHVSGKLKPVCRKQSYER